MKQKPTPQIIADGTSPVMRVQQLLNTIQKEEGTKALLSRGSEALEDTLLFLFIFFVKFLAHFYEFLSPEFFPVYQEPSPSKNTFLSMGGVELIYE